ncbi:MAG: hypothetical protein M3066_21345 [Actinomycetota bacterium]|nr:hypothetical protein [Actinomycetota bacterium]
MPFPSPALRLRQRRRGDRWRRWWWRRHGGRPGGGADRRWCRRADVTINSFAVTADQSAATADATLSATYAVARCGGNNASFDIRVQAVGATGAVGWAAADSWFPTRNLPYTGARQTDAAAFGTTYAVTLSVLVPGTGTVVATTSRSIATPAQRVASCSVITNMIASGGYNPGSTSIGAIWSGYTVQNCAAPTGSTCR